MHDEKPFKTTEGLRGRGVGEERKGEIGGVGEKEREEGKGDRGTSLCMYIDARDGRGGEGVKGEEKERDEMWDGVDR